MTGKDLELLGRQVGSKARTADMGMSRPRDCRSCAHSIEAMGCVVCKLTRLPVLDTRGGCHKYDERVNYE